MLPGLDGYSVNWAFTLHATRDAPQGYFGAARQRDCTATKMTHDAIDHIELIRGAYEYIYQSSSASNAFIIIICHQRAAFFHGPMPFSGRGPCNQKVWEDRVRSASVESGQA